MTKATSSLHGADMRDAFSRLIFESTHSLGLGDEHRSITFRLCQLLVVLLRLVTPLSYLYVFSVWAFGIRAHHFGSYYPLYYILLVWMTAEVLFLPYYYYLFVTFSNRNKKLEHVAPSSAERFLLAKRCFTALALVAQGMHHASTEVYLRKVLEGWFIDAPLASIHRENLAAWASWAFFDLDPSDLSEDQREENEQIVDFIADKAKWTFPPGHAPGVLPARLSLDPIFAVQRPLYFYVAIGLLNVVTHLFLHYVLGFVRLRKYDAPSQYVYFRPARVHSTRTTTTTTTTSIPTDTTDTTTTSTTSTTSITTDTTTTSTTSTDTATSIKVPLVFVHGIGIGFAHYVGMIMSFPTDTDVFLIEWPHVAMQMAASGPTTTHSINTVCDVLTEYKHTQACFVAHSLGTCLVSWMLHDPRACTFVHSTILLDPVTFLLCDPTVATSFIYKNPTSTLEFMMHFFVSRELFIANGLSRHFSWSHNILFVEDLLNPNPCCREAFKSQPHGCGSLTLKDVSESELSVDKSLHHHVCEYRHRVNHTIVLSSKDVIVPTQSVLTYLQAKRDQGHCTYEVQLFEGSHGEMMLHPKWISIIGDKIAHYCSGGAD